MKEINHATLDQAKKMKEHGFPQDQTDCVWIEHDNGFFLQERSELLKGMGQGDYRLRKEVLNWYASPSTQEVKLELSEWGKLTISPTGLIEFNSWVWWEGKKDRCFGSYNDAQSCCDAYIWEKGNKSIQPIIKE